MFFSPIRDKMLPDDIDGLLLGGGYPELYLKELSENLSMRLSVKAAIESGISSSVLQVRYGIHQAVDIGYDDKTLIFFLNLAD